VDWCHDEATKCHDVTNGPVRPRHVSATPRDPRERSVDPGGRQREPSAAPPFRSGLDGGRRSAPARASARHAGARWGPLAAQRLEGACERAEGSSEGASGALDEGRQGSGRSLTLGRCGRTLHMLHKDVHISVHTQT